MGILEHILYVLLFMLLILLISLYTAKIPKRITAKTVPYDVEDSLESANWINLILAAINSSRVDKVLVDGICEMFSKQLLSELHNDKSLPSFMNSISELSIRKTKPSKSAPYIEDLSVTKDNDNKCSSLKFLLFVRGEPTFTIDVEACMGTPDVPDLFSISLSFEVVFKLIIGPVKLTLYDTPKKIEFEFQQNLFELDIRPILNNGKNTTKNHVESISRWISDAVYAAISGVHTFYYV